MYVHVLERDRKLLCQKCAYKIITKLQEKSETLNKEHQQTNIKIPFQP